MKTIIKFPVILILIFSGTAMNVRASGTISGQVSYANTSGTLLNNITVSLYTADTLFSSTLTDPSGQFVFDNLPNGTYMIIPSTLRPWGGGNATDALLMLQDFTELMPLSGVYRIAGDVSTNEKVNAQDAQQVAMRFVGTLSSFVAGDWFFEKPVIFISNTNNNVYVSIDALCFGDVDGSFIPAGAKVEPLVSLYHEGIMEVADPAFAEIPIYIKDDLTAGAVSLVLDITEAIEITSVKINAPGSENLLFHTREGKLFIAWYNTEPLQLDAGSPLLTISARISGVPDDNYISMSAASEIADAEGIAIPVTLSVPKLGIAGPAFTVSVFPSPAVSQVSFSLILGEDAMISISLTDMLGRTVRPVAGDLSLGAGSHTIPVDLSGLVPGIYNWKLTELTANNRSEKSRRFVLGGK